ncbi:MAG: hypothetical protein DDT30_00831 [Dehalococcoidia bacterium]|nr:hypothetical protein [Bacillota bacterium]
MRGGEGQYKFIPSTVTLARPSLSIITVGQGLAVRSTLEDTTHIDVGWKKILVVFLKSCVIVRIRGIDSKIRGLNRKNLLDIGRQQNYISINGEFGEIVDLLTY